MLEPHAAGRPGRSALDFLVFVDGRGGGFLSFLLIILCSFFSLSSPPVKKTALLRP